MASPKLHPLVLAWCLLLGLFAQAEESQPQGIGAPAGKVTVHVGIYMIDLIEVDGVAQTFTADLWTKLEWVDPRLAKAGAGLRRFSRENVWYPRLLVGNVRASDRRWPDEVTVTEEGKVTFLQRSLSTFACSLDLRKFPHDKQRLHTRVFAVETDRKDLEFVIDSEGSGRSDQFTITDWEVGEAQLTAGLQRVSGANKTVPGFEFEIEIQRISRYYMGTIFATVAIIALMAWLVYWLPLGALAPRVSVSVTAMLTLIAYRFVAQQDLPKLPYLTRMDFFLLGAAVLILIGMVTVVVVANQEGKGNTQLARRLNLWFRWAYPVVLCALLLAFAAG